MKIPDKLTGLINESSDILITCHINPDGDAVGASIALAMGLKFLGKKIHISNRDTVPENLKFLPFSELFSQEVPDREFDILFIVDCNTIERTGLKNLRAKNTVIIDHHIMPDNAEELWDRDTLDRSMVSPDASASGEIVFRVLNEIGVTIDKDIATNLYTTLLFDTGGFRYANTTPESLEIASRLVAAGAEPWWITKELYESVPYNALQLLALAYSTLKREGEVAWMTVTQEMFKETGTTSENTEDFVDHPRKIKGVGVAIFFREDAGDICKVSLRSKGGLDVQKIAALFGGGGHAPAAGCSISATLVEAQEKVLSAVREALNSK